MDSGPRPTILAWRRLLICLGGGLLAAGVTAVAGVLGIAVLAGGVATVALGVLVVIL